MTVAELIEILSEVDPNRVVVISSDSEGNHYSGDIGIGRTGCFNSDSKQVKLEKLTPSLIKQGYAEEDVGNPDEYVPCVVLWP